MNRIQKLFSREFDGEPFRLFSPSHLAALGAVGAASLALVPLRRFFKKSVVRRRFRHSLATVLLVNEGAWHVWNLATGQWKMKTMLPLHLCSAMVFTSAAMLLTRSPTLYEYVYFAGIGGGVQALFTPGLSEHDYPHFCYFQTFTSHGSIVVAALYMTLIEGYRPTKKSMLRVLTGLNLAIIPIAIINKITGGNYLYIAHKPEIPTLIDSLGPWPWYIIPMQLIGVGMVGVLYLPFALHDWHKRKGKLCCERERM